MNGSLMRRALHIGCAAPLVLSTLFLAPSVSLAAGTTGTISGTVRETTSSAPIAGVSVTASSPSQKLTVTTDAAGFYSLQNLAPDTYTVSFQRDGYEPRSVSGVTVFQDQTVTLDQTMPKSTIKEIGRVTARSSANLVQPGQTADVYNLTTTQFNAAQGGDNLHKTLFNYLQSVPGITGSGMYAQPRVRGGLATDVAYELDGIPINDRLTGFFTTNLANIGVGSVEVYTGGYNARYGNAAQGVFNSVIKRGTYPGFGLISTGVNVPTYGHYVTAEYGWATPDNKFSAYLGFDGSNTANDFYWGQRYYPLINLFGIVNGPGPVKTTDIIGNFHWRPNQRDDIQFLMQNGVGTFNFDYSMAGTHPMQIAPCAGYQAPGGVPTVGGTSITGKPCVVNGTPTGLQYIEVPPTAANVWRHYSGLGKLQWNHIFNDKLAGYLRFAENFNQYIFDQPIDDPNLPGSVCGGLCKSGDVAQGFGLDNGTDDFYGDRRSNMYIGTMEMDWNPSAQSSYYAGIQYERDNDMQAYYDREGINSAKPAGGSAFDVNGNWPNLYTLVNWPLTMPSAYIGTTQKVGKWTFEPSVRYDGMNYLTPVGDYFRQAWDPRFAFSYAASQNTVIRGSYTVTSTFVPAAYVYNASPDGTNATGSNRTPFAPGADVHPSMDHNVDFSWEQQLDPVLSLRVSPFYHHSTSKLSFVRNYTLINGIPKFTGQSLPKNNGETRDTGIEIGLNRSLPPAQNGLSWFLSATYQNYWSSSLNLLSPFGGFVNPTTYITSGLLFRNPDNPPYSVSWTADYHHDRFHAMPFLLWQCCAYYNVTGGLTTPAPGVDTTIHTSPGYFYGNMTFTYDLFPAGSKGLTAGMRIQNFTNNTKADVPPSQNVCYNGGHGGGCVPGGVSDGVAFSYPPGVLPDTQWFWPPVTENPLEIEFFLTSRF